MSVDLKNKNALCPRRGPKTYMNEGGGKDIILAEGELFIEYPDSGLGTGPCKIKIGDGVSEYSKLPYAIGWN